MSRIRLENVNIVFSNGRNPVKNFSAVIPEGELMALVGPATCGKSVLIRMIAGLESPTGGTIYFGEDPVNLLSAQERETVIISKEQTLYPDLTVYENIAIGLRLKRMDPEVIDRRIHEICQLLPLEPVLAVQASQLTPEQMHRVTLARYAVRRPRVMLIDEPYSQLETAVRESLLQDLKRLNSSLGITMVYATGNVLDAYRLGCRLCIIHRGQLQQLGTWEDVTRRPATAFVAGYVSDTLTNYLEVLIEKGSAGLWARLAGQGLKIPGSLVMKYGLNSHVGETCLLGIHADSVIFSRTAGLHALKGRVFSKEVHEGRIFWTAKAGTEHVISTSFDQEIRLNEEIYMNFNMDDATFQFR